MPVSAIKSQPSETVLAINRQVLELICSYSKENPVKSQVMFGLPATLVDELANINTQIIDNLSWQPVCLLTLRNASNQSLWTDMLLSARENSTSYRLNLASLTLMHMHESGNRKVLRVNSQKSG